MKQSKIHTAIGAALLVLIAVAAGWLWYLSQGTGDASLGASKSFNSPENPAHPVRLDQNNINNNGASIIPKNAPVVTGFIGDLLNQGNKQEDGTVEPFVVGESLRLEAEALNAVEYKWTVNGEVLKEKGQEWSVHPERFYDVEQPGRLTFTVQVRGADKDLLSQVKAAALTILPLKIIRLAKAIIHDDDEHFVTGETLSLEVEMAQNMKADLDFYQFRYFVNDAPIKHPDDGEEWTTNDTLTYTFTSPGSYIFKVEARRADHKEAEDHVELPETVVAADAVLLSFDSNPSNEKGAPVGSQIYLSGFPTSRYGKSECRIGAKRINLADFNWLTEDNGSQWGDPYRTWVPVEPGTYVVRCEIREIGKEVADDFREMVFTVVDGNF